MQLAGVAALEGPQDAVDAMVSEYRRRRDVIVDGLNAMKGVTCTKPDGAFYAFPNITRTGLGSAEVTDYLLNEAGVAVLNGSAFGNAGSGYLRISYATSMEVISKGLERIEGALKELAG